MLGTAIPTFITVITKDKDRSVAMATLQSLNEVLKAVKSLIVDEQGHPDAIANAARTVLMQKVGSKIIIGVLVTERRWSAHQCRQAFE